MLHIVPILCLIFFILFVEFKLKKEFTEIREEFNKIKKQINKLEKSIKNDH